MRFKQRVLTPLMHFSMISQPARVGSKYQECCYRVSATKGIGSGSWSREDQSPAHHLGQDD